MNDQPDPAFVEEMQPLTKEQHLIVREGACRTLSERATPEDAAAALTLLALSNEIYRLERERDQRHAEALHLASGLHEIGLLLAPTPDDDELIIDRVRELLAQVASLRGSLAAALSAPDETRGTWQPIESFPRELNEAFFWIVPKTADEAYTDTSGRPIVANFEGRLHRGPFKSWSALSKATHWMPLPAPPLSGTTETHT